jgi:membrane-bound metal-dependent hydrolase YbcI (DUF457 family)
MDPVSHVAFGRTLIALDSRRTFGRGAVAACVLGSLMPDIDAVLMPFGWDIYLRHHQGGTHSLVGSLGCAALTAAIGRLVSKRDHFLPLLLAAWAGTAGHLLLDVISGADVRFGWPFGRSVALPLFAMADPWLGGVLVFGLAALVARRANPGRIGGAILIATTILAAGKAVLYTRALNSARTAPGSSEGSRAEVSWGSLTRWITYEARADVVEARRVDAFDGNVTPLFRMPRGLEDPLVVRSRGLDTVRNFLASHGVTFAIVIGGSAERRLVLWSDLRYCGPPGDRSSMPWGPPDLGSGLPIACALWFGGEFDAATGRPTAAVVYVGHFVQRRPIR